MREALPAGHPDIATALNNLAAILAEQAKYAEAEPLYREALAIDRAGRPGGHPDIATDLNNLASLLWRQGKLDQSIPMFEEALSIREASFGRQHRDTLATVANLGVNYKNAGRLSEAIPLLEEAYRASQQQPSIAWVANSLLDAYAKAADPARPESIARFTALVQEVLSDIRAKRPENSPELGRHLFMSGQTLFKLKAWAEAEPLLRESLALSERYGPDEWQTFNIMSMLGGALLGQKKYAEAESLLLQGYSGLQERAAAVPPQGKVLISEALDRLIELFTATNQADEVSKWQAERAKYADMPKEPEKQ
jgi:tetratricopeptide (TPR) repeat protein